MSTATVSYVVNGTRHVAESTAARVLAAIAELRFSPSRRAVGLRTGRSSTIGVILDDVTNRFAANFTQGLQAAASAASFTIIITDLQRDPANEGRSLARLLEEEVAGIVYAGLGAVEADLVEAHAQGTPVVVVDKPLVTNALPSVLIDGRAGICDAMLHLLRLGHRNVVYLAGLRVNRNTVLRAQVFEAFCVEHGLAFDERSILYGDYSLEHGYAATLELLRDGRQFTALLCGDDIVAFAAIAALKSRGMRVPQDVAVVGFDDDPMAALFDPSLTTVHYPMVEMGRAAFGVINAHLAGQPAGTGHIVLETRLVVRRSTDSTCRDYHTGR